MADTDVSHFWGEGNPPWEAVARYSVNTIPVQNKSAPVSAVYAIRNLRSGNFYIGSSEHVVRRLRAHLSELRRGIHHSLRLQMAWTARGEDVFEFSILRYCPVRDLIDFETEFVQRLAPVYNTAICMDNGMRGRRHSPEAIAKMKENRKGKGCGPRVFSDEHKRAISRARMGFKCGPRPPMSTAQREKIAAAQRLRMSDIRNNPKTKPVLVDGVRYECCRDAARALKVHATRISDLIRSGKITLAVNP